MLMCVDIVIFKGGRAAVCCGSIARGGSARETSKKITPPRARTELSRGGYNKGTHVHTSSYTDRNRENFGYKTRRLEQRYSRVNRF